MYTSLLCVLACFVTSQGVEQVRDLPDSWREDIRAQQDDVDKILNYLLHGAGKSQSYDRLAEFVDKFGDRFTGSQGLEDSIDYMKQALIEEGFENVHTEDVTVPQWVRGEEKAMMLQPRQAEIYVMGLMDSISGVVEADAIVVRDFDELYRRSSEVPGKIVVYNQEWIDYLSGYIYRTEGATRAADLGAVGALIRSVTDFSLYSPHTGSQRNALHVVDETIRISIEASHDRKEDVISRNLIAEIRGSELPNEVVMFGGHIDSWDVGVGAMDDGGGIMITRQILTAIKQLNLRPKRTMRLVMWTAEEIGIIGGHAYWQAHKEEINDMVLVMESDIGTFSALGLHFHNMSGLAQAIMEEILESYLHEINGDNWVIGGLGKADINDWIMHGVPGASLYTQNDLYFYYHHTEADRMLIQDPGEMDRCASVFAVAAYVVANMDQRLPLVGDYPVEIAAPASAVSAQASVLVLLVAVCSLLMANSQ